MHVVAEKNRDTVGQGVNATDVQTCQLTMFREVIQMTRVRVRVTVVD